MVCVLICLCGLTFDLWLMLSGLVLSLWLVFLGLLLWFCGFWLGFGCLLLCTLLVFGLLTYYIYWRVVCFVCFNVYFVLFAVICCFCIWVCFVFSLITWIVFWFWLGCLITLLLRFDVFSILVEYLNCFVGYAWVACFSMFDVLLNLFKYWLVCIFVLRCVWPFVAFVFLILRVILFDVLCLFIVLVYFCFALWLFCWFCFVLFCWFVGLRFTVWC